MSLLRSSGAQVQNPQYVLTGKKQTQRRAASSAPSSVASSVAAASGGSIRRVAVNRRMRSERDFKRALENARNPYLEGRDTDLSTEELRAKPWSSDQKKAYEKVVRQNIKHHNSAFDDKGRYHVVKTAEHLYVLARNRARIESNKQSRANTFIEEMKSVRTKIGPWSTGRYINQNTMREYFQKNNGRYVYSSNKGRSVLCHAQNTRVGDLRYSKKHLLKAGLLTELNEWICWRKNSRDQPTEGSKYDLTLISSILSCLIGGIVVGEDMQFFPFYKLDRVGASGGVTVVKDTVKNDAFRRSFNENPKMRWSLKHKDYDANPPRQGRAAFKKTLDIWGELGGLKLLTTLEKLVEAFNSRRTSNKIRGSGSKDVKKELCRRGRLLAWEGGAENLGWSDGLYTPVWSRIHHAVEQWQNVRITEGLESRDTRSEREELWQNITITEGLESRDTRSEREERESN